MGGWGGWGDEEGGGDGEGVGGRVGGGRSRGSMVGSFRVHSNNSK